MNDSDTANFNGSVSVPTKKKFYSDPWIKKPVRLMAMGMGFDSLSAHRHKERCGIGTDYCAIEVAYRGHRYKFETSLNSMSDFGGAVYVGDIKQVEWVRSKWTDGQQSFEPGGLTAVKDNDPVISQLIKSGQIEALMRACHKTYFDRRDKLVKRIHKLNEQETNP